MKREGGASVVGASYAPLDTPDAELLHPSSSSPPSTPPLARSSSSRSPSQPAIRGKVREFFSVPQSQRAEFLCMVLCGFFFVNTVTAELISGKLFVIGPFTVSIGSIMWPCVFITTDVTNEYFGKLMVRRLSYLMAVFLGAHVSFMCEIYVRIVDGNNSHSCSRFLACHTK
eukprot:Phypoly_transcript_11661.p2 GENE.Phypoly_transcript_11661~~Phypoly_transcript_11661.p2  ORF type:complete len:171 (+),score=21.75 Phypoly_transcript_11661:120-632(+)